MSTIRRKLFEGSLEFCVETRTHAHSPDAIIRHVSWKFKFLPYFSRKLLKQGCFLFFLEAVVRYLTEALSLTKSRMQGLEIRTVEPSIHRGQSVVWESFVWKKKLVVLLIYIRQTSLLYLVCFDQSKF